MIHLGRITIRSVRERCAYRPGAWRVNGEAGDLFFQGSPALSRSGNAFLAEPEYPPYPCSLLPRGKGGRALVHKPAR